MKKMILLLSLLVACTESSDPTTIPPDAGAPPDCFMEPIPTCKLSTLDGDNEYCSERWPTTFAVQCGYNTQPLTYDCVKRTDVPWHCCCPVQGGCF